jgi:hypothetical protein
MSCTGRYPQRRTKSWFEPLRLGHWLVERVKRIPAEGLSIVLTYLLLAVLGVLAAAAVVAGVTLRGRSIRPPAPAVPAGRHRLEKRVR